MSLSLLPASNKYIDKVGFQWQIVDIVDEQLTIDIFFENTDYVSVDQDFLDIMSIKFHNTDQYMKPEGEGLNSIFDGFVINCKVPVQLPREDHESYVSLEAGLKLFFLGSFV